MRNDVLLKLIILFLVLNHGVGNAATIQSSASVKSSQFLEGTNLADDSPALSLSADLSWNNGNYVGVNCYTSSVNRDQGIGSGCDLYAGYFMTLKKTGALSMQITRHEYAPGLGHKWDFTQASMSWHTNKRTKLTATYSKNWLKRPFDTLTIKAESQFALSEKLNLNLAGSIMGIESGAPVNSLLFAKASLSYTQDRWTTEAGIIYTDNDQKRMVPFEVDEAELLLTLRYRLY